jgi:hypothetical protein
MVTSNYDNLLTAQELEEYHAQRVDVRRRAEHPAQLVGSSVPKRTRAGCGYTYYGHTILAYLHRYRGMATTAHSAYTSKPATSSHYYGHTHCGYTYHGYTYHGYTYHGYTIVNVLDRLWLYLLWLYYTIVSVLEQRAAVQPLRCEVRLRPAIVVHLDGVREGVRDRVKVGRRLRARVRVRRPWPWSSTHAQPGPSAG